MRLPSRRHASVTAGIAAVLAVGGLVVATPPASAAPVPGDDAPTYLTPKGDREDGSDEQGFDKLRDAYYWSDLLAGDDGGIDGDKAAALRAKAVQENNATATSDSKAAGGPSGTWANQGQSPVVQVARTSNTLEAVSGRVTALVIRPDGTVIAGGAQGGVWTYDQTTKVWTSRSADTDTQSVGALAESTSNPDVVYLGTGEGNLAGDSYYGNGVYRSDNGGVSWRKVSGDSFVGVSTSQIVVDPRNADHLFIATLRGRAGAQRVTPPGAKVYGVYESKDGGTTWALRKGTTDELHGATDLVMDPTSPSTLWASFWGDQIYRTTNSGATWQPVMGDLPHGNFLEGGTRFALGLSHPRGAAKATVYVGFDYFDSKDVYHESQLWKTTNDGAHYALTGQGTGIDSIVGYCGTQCFYDNLVRPDPRDPDTVYLLGLYGYDNSPQSGGIFRSKDGGATWKNLGYDLHPDYHAFAYDPNDRKHVVLGNDGGVWQSHKGGGRNQADDPLSAADWENLNGQVDPATGALVHDTKLTIGQFVSAATVPQVPGQYWGGTQDNGTQRKSTLNNRWFDQAGGDGGKLIVDQTTQNTVNPAAAAYVFGEYYSISPFRFSPSTVSSFNGNEAIDGGIDTTDRSEFYVPMVQNRGRVNQLFLGTYRLYRTDNAETANAADVTWSPISGDLTGGCTQTAPNGARGCLISAIGVADGGSGVYVGTDDGYLQVSPDAVTAAKPTFRRVGVGVLPKRPVAGFAVDRSNWLNAYAYYNGFSAATPKQPGHVFHTTDGGRSWTNVTGNLPDVPVNSVQIDPSNPKALYAGTDVGVYTTTDAGRTWAKLGTGMPKVSTWSLDYDATNGVLLAGTHGRGAYTLTSSKPTPALVESTTTSGKPVGPGSQVDYTISVRNFGSGPATGVKVRAPLPPRSAFVSAGGGGTVVGDAVTWTGKSIAKGATLTLTFSVQLSGTQPAGATGVVLDGPRVTSAEGPGTVGSPLTTRFAKPDAVTLQASQTAAAKPGATVSYPLVLTNTGYQAGAFTLTANGTWTTKVFAADCTTPVTTTATVAPGASLSLCATVKVPAGAGDSATKPSTVTAKSTTAPTATSSVTLTTIAYSDPVLVVDGDSNAPDVASYYTDALTAAGVAYDTWDLTANPTLPASVLTTHEKVVWWTGNTYPAPVSPYEPQLTAFLNGGGGLFLSGQDVLDQSAGTTAFVRNYLHVDWDGTERQNDKETATVSGVAANPVTAGVGTVPLDHDVLGATYEDEITPIDPAASAFTDDTGATDGLTVKTDGYAVVFLAFPFEAYGTAAQKATLMQNVLTYLG
ncbi:hypothetical protein ACXR2U_14795 [Jatrophihabitans sp. YIM 134969]